MILQFSFLLSAVLLFVQLCSALDIRWYTWLSASQLPTGLNLSTCGDCYDQALKYLDEIHQDITYANKTFDIERIASKLSRHLGDLDGAYDEHSTGFRQSRDSLNNSINAFLSQNKLSLTSDLENGTHQIIDEWETRASSSQQAAIGRLQYSFEDGKLKSRDLCARLNLTLVAHQRDLDKLSYARTQLFYIDRDYKQTNHTHKFGDLVEHSAKELEFFINQSRSALSAQTKDGMRIDIIYSGYVTKLHHLTSMSQEFRAYTSTQVAPLILGEILSDSTAKHKLHLSSETRLEDNLSKLLVKSQTSLNNTQQTMARLFDLRQSIRSNGERDADENIVLANSHKDTKNLFGKLDKLTQRLKSSNEQAAKLKAQLDKLESLDQSAVAVVRNLTLELAQKNVNLSKWYNQELVTQQETLTLSYDQIIENFRRETANNLTEERDILELTRQVEDIVNHVHEINTTIASINRTMNLQNFLVASHDDKEQQEWRSKELAVSLLNSTKSLKSTALSTSENQVSQLRQLVQALTSELEQARLYQGETHDIMKYLDLARQTISPRNYLNQTYEKLAAAIDESSAVKDHISSNVSTAANDMFERFTLVASNLVHDTRSKSSQDRSLDLKTLAQEISISSDNFIRLKNTTVDALNLTLVVNQTQQADNEMRASIKSLRDKVHRARSLLNQLKLRRKDITDAQNISTSPPIGLALSLPQAMAGQSSSFTSISFLIRMARADTNELVLFIGAADKTTPAPHESCHSKRILVKLLRGHLALDIQLGPNSLTEIRDDEQLIAGRDYRVVILKVGVLLNISIQSSRSTNSITRILSGPYLTFNMNPNESEISVGGLARPFDNCQEARGVDLSSFTGQMDKLEVNGHQLGLWNTQSRYSLTGNYISNISNGQACELLAVSAQETPASPERVSEHSVRSGRMASFARPKSNTSSSFIQMLHSDNELDQLLMDASDQLQSNDTMTERPKLQQQGHIRELTLSFRTRQPNGLILHYARPDHSSFLSIYISGGRLMLAFNFDKKIRYESHFPLGDGQWHHLSLILRHDTARTRREAEVNRGQKLVEACDANSTSCNNNQSQQQVEHALIAILDDKHLYHEEYNLTITHEVTTTTATHADSARENLHHEPSPSDRFSSDHMTNTDNHSRQQPDKKLLYFGGLEDKYSPLLRSQQIPTNFHGCLADVTINRIWMNFAETNKSPGITLGACELD